MSNLLSRLRRAQVPQEAFTAPLDQWDLSMLRQERIACGTKHYNKTFEQVWHQDQQWVIFIIQRYSTSEKVEHKRFVKFVELMLDEVEGNRTQRPVLPRANLPTMAAGSPYPDQPLPDHRLDESDDWELEPIVPSYQPTMNSETAATQTAMQERILFLESTLQQVIQHVGTMNSVTNGCGHQPGQSLVSHDEWTDPALTMHHESQHFRNLAIKIQHEFDESGKSTRPVGKPFHLGEVFCSEQSPVTQQVQALGGQAFRYGLAQGDLANPQGRRELFRMIHVHRPRHVWYSPTCGPWSSWTSLNESRSLESFDKYQSQRHSLLYTIALGVVLFRHQIQRGNHFHWEQPQKSLMFQVPAIAEIHGHTQACQFDLCEAGHLVDPVSNLPMKKGMIVLTSSHQVYHHFHGQCCRRQHVHQPIEGHTRYKGRTILRSQYSEVYPRRFARSLARLLCSNQWERPFNWEYVGNLAKAESAEVFVGTIKTIKTRQKSNFPRAELSAPPTSAELQSKRRRLEGKQAAPTSKEQLEEMFEQINRVLPRVGKTELTQSSILRTIQELCSDKQVIRVVGCRGTDRTMSPPDNMHSQEAPFRRAVMLLRTDGSLRYERHWEKWDTLAHRQIIRPSHPCRIRVTVFARDFSASSSSSSSSQPIQEPASTVAKPSVSVSSSDPIEATPSATEPHASELKAQSAMDMTNGGAIESRTAQPRDAKPGEQGLTFQSLPKWEQQMIIRMHKNLGHPSNARLVQALQTAQYRPAVVQAAAELKCSTCAACSPPRHQRPATLKPSMEFNDKIYLDKVTWTNQQGRTLHFYHILDAGSNYHVAIASPSGTSASVTHLLQQHWFSWAGPPQELTIDSGSEMNSQEFSDFLQNSNIKGNTIPPEAHWQAGKIERHGKFLQEMLTKIDLEHPVSSYEDLQAALNQSTHAKNALSIRHGYAPEIIVFGKHSRIPGSVLSDESLPSHSQAIQEEDHPLGPQGLRRQLSLRESARRAFHTTDNSSALRRSILKRSCPTRGPSHRNDWVMIWKNTQGEPRWVGPQRVILQDGNTSVWTTQAGKLYQRAPEHVRHALPEEGTPADINPSEVTNMERQILRMEAIPEEEEDRNPINSPPENNPPDQPTAPREPSPIPQVEVTRSELSTETLQQPESEQTASQEPTEDGNPGQDEETLQLLCMEEESLLQVTTEQHLAWRFEVEPRYHSLLKHNLTPHEEAIALLASSNRKQRSEVRLTELTPQEREQFEEAKQSEISNWINTGTISKILRDQVSPEQILRCRWIYTWKDLDSAEQAGMDNPSTAPRKKKAKARLVVLGYLDPSIEEIPRDSPTLNRTSRMLILQVISSLGFSLQSFDIKAAFLQGEPQAGRVMALDPVPELRKALQLGPDHIAKLNKGAYGLVDAPYLWYRALNSELLRLGFEASPFDPCTYVLREPPTSSQHGQIAGILGVHVDDGLGGGNEYFQSKINLLEKKYPFGSKKSQSFTFTGIELTQQGDNSIVMNQSKYINRIPAIHIDINRKNQNQAPVTEAERLSLRGLVGSLQYAAVNTRPDLASRLSLLQSTINSATIENLLEGNRLLHDAKRHCDVQVVIKPIPIESYRFMAFSDASFASVHKPSSHTGMIIVGTHEKILQKHQCSISPIAWGCKKIQRVVTSTLSAESTALSSTLDQLAWLRLYWSWIHNPKTVWKNPDVGLKEIPEAISVPTISSQVDLAVTDCKSLFDLVTRTAPPACSEFRVQLVARAIKEALSEGVRLRWVHSGAQLADALTKSMDSRFLRETLRLGEYRLSDEDAILKERAKTRDRIQWLKDSSKTEEK